MSGDPVCWLGQLCPECGAMPTDDAPDRCWRCGTARSEGGPAGSPDPTCGDAGKT